MRQIIWFASAIAFAFVASPVLRCAADDVPEGVEIPPAVRIARPSAEEVAVAEKALAAFAAAADPKVKAVLTKYPALVEVRPPKPNTAIIPNLARNFQRKHDDNVKVAKEGKAELLFMGDSITDFWRNQDGPYAGKAVLEKHFGGVNVANFGIAGDTTQGVLFRLQDGEGEGFSPKAIMLMIGTNNTGRNSAEEIAEGIGAVVMELREHFPAAKILLLAVFPRGRAQDPVRTTIADINAKIAKLDDGEHVQYLDIGPKFLDESGNIPRDVMSDGLHPSAAGYEIWADEVEEPLAKLMGRELAAAAP